MNLQALRSELDIDPESLGYSGMSDAEIAASLNTRNRPAIRPLSSTELLAWSGASDRYKRIRVAANDLDHPAYSIANVALLLIQRDGTSLDLRLSDRQQMLGGLVATGVLTDDDQASLLALASDPKTRGEEIGVGFVEVTNILLARTL